MSRTTVKGIYPGEKTTNVMELRNSHGSAPPVWEAMAERYLNVTKSYDHPNPGWMQLNDTLWDLWKRHNIPVEHRMVFMLTFDRAYVAKKDYARMAEAIRKFLVDFPPKEGCVNHWQALYNLFVSDPDIPGVGLYCTSVSDDPFNGEWNKEKEDYDPPDWSEIYDLCEQLDELEKERVRA